ncbi:hypothetical protein PPERSA_05035 [Pseudocohnilembus persalinus]|uniref:Cilia- and flagella-associated protein 58 central coiled coil domain-containing protein n=1 Tax=Pseudocohnilembus persalinus TaxID=266149 RepID=A0A0V0QW54_PSEPJ|nr:hypothetical protein PPERSA_05035 [Pseudocohnilembus persalinus]|eukprot:KRX06422.1 hypothetical protein PPERSA_05035 [Pseudocohnilembus persalinus]
MAEENFGIGTEAFDVLEKEFQEVLNDLAADQSLEKFRVEYEKLHKALKVSHENEKRLLAKCRELSAELQSNVAKVQGALNMTLEDNQNISLLRQQLEETYKKLEESKEKEESFKQQIENLHNDINLLQQQLVRNQAAMGGGTNVHDLIIAKEELQKEEEILKLTKKNNEEDLMSINEKIQKATMEREQCQERYDEIIRQKDELEQKTMLEDEGKKKNQEALNQIKKKYDDNLKDIEVQKLEKEKQLEYNKKVHNEILQIDNQIQEQKKEVKKAQKEEKDQEKKDLEIKKDIENLDQLISQLAKKKRELEYQKAKLEIKREDLQTQEKRLRVQIQEIKEITDKEEQVRDITNAGINQLENEILMEKKYATDDRSLLEELRRNRDILQKEIDRAEQNNKKQQESCNTKEKLQKERKNEAAGLKKEIDRCNNIIKSLVKEEQKYSEQVAQANAKYFHSLEEIKLKENLISEFQKKNIETEAKLKQQQNLYEAVRSDRNLYSKNLTETQEEIAEIKRRYKIVNHQISQLKEEIDSKEASLSKEHFEHKKKDRLIEEQARSIKKYMEDIHQKEDKIKTYITQISKLHFMIKESEQQRQKLKEEYDLVVAERDILGTQLIRRNAEAGLLYEKIKINQSTLKKGEVQYTERLGDIILLKSQIADLINDIKTYKSQANSIGNMKNEIHNLSKELIEEKLKGKALAEEMENPMNVHRWRKLKATDSETYELMTKIQSLQKRLIQKTEQVQDKEQDVNSRDKQLKELRDIMRRQPGIEEQKMIPVYQQSLKQKTQQMRAMNGEMIMYQTHLSEYKLEIDRLNKDLQSNKKKYYEQKKREQQKREQENPYNQGTGIRVNLPNKRFTGGGFNLAVNH